MGSDLPMLVGTPPMVSHALACPGDLLLGSTQVMSLVWDIPSLGRSWSPHPGAHPSTHPSQQRCQAAPLTLAPAAAADAQDG